jgi:hypothetical protein
MLNICNENNKHVIYHWWNDNINIKPYEDLRNPVVLSIATLRSFHKKIPITILDVSDFERPKEDWVEFQKALNFQVVKTKTSIDTSSPRYWKVCSKVSDISKNIQFLKEDNIIFVDSDIFFVKPILPLSYEDHLVDKFCCLPYNTGFFYFNHKLEKNQKVLEIWNETIVEALKNENFYEELHKVIPYYPSKSLHDEICMHYLFKQKKINNIKKLDFDESFIFSQEHIFLANYGKFDNFELIFKKIKFIHAITAFNGNKRGILCLLIKEINDLINKSLNKRLIKKIFRHEMPLPSYCMSSIMRMTNKQFNCLLN